MYKDYMKQFKRNRTRQENQEVGKTERKENLCLSPSFL